MTPIPASSARSGRRAPRLLVVATMAQTIWGFLLPITSRFRALGWRVDALASEASASIRCRESFDHAYEAPWTRSLLHLGNYTTAPRAVRRIVAEGEYDIVHVHTPIAAWITRTALRKVRRTGRPKVVYTAHGFHFHQGGSRLGNFAFRRMEMTAGHWTDKLVVINREDYEAARKWAIVPPGQIAHIPGIGVDTARLTPESVPSAQIEQFKKSLHLAPGNKLLLVSGEFTRNKRHVDVVQALANLQQRQVHLAIAGSGSSQEAKIKQLVERLNLSQQVHFLGFRSDMPLVMRAADAVVVASWREGLSRTILEALSLGVPVIGSRIRGNTELLADGAGLLFDAGSVEQLTAAIRDVVQGRAPVAEMIRTGRKRVLAYDVQNVITLHEGLYASLLPP